MEISVVIPVFNAERFLADAVDSALLQSEVREILLVQDGSTDGSNELCRRLQEANPGIVKLIQHPEGENKGASETRNLGMQKATSEYLAFLDADDVYLPGRFSETEKLFQQHKGADGMYESVGTRREDFGLPETILHRAGSIPARIAATDPAQLFGILAQAKKGSIHLNGLTLRRSAVNDDLCFDPKLRQCQDTDFVLRWAAWKKLYGVHPDREVALRRVHDKNRVFDLDEALHFRYLCMRKCAVHGFYGSTDIKANWEILNRMARATQCVVFARRLHMPVTPFRLISIFGFLLIHPSVIWHLLSR